VPGRVGSSPAAGTNSLLRDGAQVIRCGQDVLDSLLGAGALSRAQVVDLPRQDDLDPELASALDAVDQGAETLDAIARSSGGSPQSVTAAVTRLELLGLLRCDSNGRYRRAASTNT
jgi:predicted Rossmann fold nucleotide-binding protein DprA/Smf involved in DNA uptake